MSSNDHILIQCNEKDEETLLIFKKGINDSDGDQLSTWLTEKDCCAWEGVHCDNITGRVTELDLKNQYLKGEMNLSILELEFLSYLDLSENYFDVINIPATQHNITHKSNLFYLDLSNNFVGLHMDNLDWLSPLSSLKYLNLSGTDLHKETNWLHAVATLPSLLELHLSGCNLNKFIINPSLEYLNLSSLLTLDLFGNNITSQLPNWFFNLTKDLTYLDLSGNKIHGEIPSSLINLKNLRHLDLYYNMLSGSILSIVGNLSSLRYLSIGGNDFSDEISKKTFSKLSNLDSLDLSNSNFVFQFDLDWVPPFQLSTLSLSNTNQGPNFPSWIYTQKSLQFLDLSSSGISVVDINKFSNLIERIPILYLSNNSMTGDISNLTLKCDWLWLDHNNFTGGLPNISPMAYNVDLSYNSFSGSIPHSWKNLKYLSYINLWSNKLSGEVLVHVSSWPQLQSVNLGENKFSGTIPIKMSPNLEVIILRSNKFKGSIPKCVYNLTQMITFTMNDDSESSIELFTKGHEYYVPPYTNPGMGVGFAAGFWGICGSLFLIRKWRHA
ncbi:hypothetical protein P8452_20196 [Trifolium repens]|nr:hypothetical protein P8452_20196 [Trifolium repens]